MRKRLSIRWCDSSIELSPNVAASPVVQCDESAGTARVNPD